MGPAKRSEPSGAQRRVPTVSARSSTLLVSRRGDATASRESQPPML